jgi:hypothetical protein
MRLPVDEVTKPTAEWMELTIPRAVYSRGTKTHESYGSQIQNIRTPRHGLELRPRPPNLLL